MVVQSLSSGMPRGNKSQDFQSDVVPSPINNYRKSVAEINKLHPALGVPLLAPPKDNLINSAHLLSMKKRGLIDDEGPKSIPLFDFKLPAFNFKDKEVKRG